MSDKYRTRKRATDGQMKEEVLGRLLVVWEGNPDLRLMQLLGNVFRQDAYNIEDYDAIKMIEDSYDRP